MKLWLAFSLLVLVGVVHGADAPTQTTLYKSVGPDGRTVYGDRPPVDGRSAQTMKFENLPSSPLSPATLAYLEQLKKGGGTASAPLPGGELVLFTTSWCGYCKKAKAYLASKGARYKEVDIESKRRRRVLRPGWRPTRCASPVQERPTRARLLRQRI